MATRTDELRRLFQPHLPMFGPRHRAALEELVELAAVGERTLATFGLPRPERRPKRPRTLEQLIWAALKEANRPLRIAEIAREVKARGYRSSSANFGKMVGAALTLMQMELRRVAPGTYTLA